MIVNKRPGTSLEVKQTTLGGRFANGDWQYRSNHYVCTDGIFLHIGTQTSCMSRNITISDDVYRRLKREKGDRSFSNIIEERLNSSGQLADVTGQKIFHPGTHEQVSEKVDTLSVGTLEKHTDKTH